MKKITKIACILILASSAFSAFASAQKNAEPSRQIARIMGDIMVLQMEPNNEARRAVESRLDGLEAAMVKNQQEPDVALMKMLDAVSRAFFRLDRESILANDEMHKLLSSYENFFQSNSFRTRRDAAFLVLDLRFRYLARTAVSPYGLMTVPPLRYAIEDVLPDTDIAVMAEVRRQKNPGIQRDWVFLKNLIVQYNEKPAPRMVDYMSLRLCQRNLAPM